MKMVCVFEKSERLRHIGHLDLMRAMQRALRRSGLPICFSQGFNPHVLITFAMPLSVGIVGDNEVMEIPVADDQLPEKEFVEKLNRALPPEMQCVSARKVDDTHLAPMALLRAAQYKIIFDEPNTLYTHIADFMLMGSIMAMRKTKSGEKECDIRPMIYAVSGDENTLTATLSLCEAGTCKPEVMLKALCDMAGVPVPHAITHRAHLYADRFVPLEEA